MGARVYIKMVRMRWPYVVGVGEAWGVWSVYVCGVYVVCVLCVV